MNTPNKTRVFDLTRERLFTVVLTFSLLVALIIAAGSLSPTTSSPALAAATAASSELSVADDHLIAAEIGNQPSTKTTRGATARRITPATATNCDTPLVITTTDDNINECGTLRSALDYLSNNPLTTTKTVSFTLPPASHIQLVGSGLVIPAGVTLNGWCAGSGEPQVILDGTGITGSGLTLSGGDTLRGIAVGGFSGVQITTTTSTTSNAGPNRLSCVKVKASAAEIVAASGDNQSAPVTTDFSQPISLTARRWYGEPLAGAALTLTIVPAQNGASAIFTSGGSGGAISPTVITATTDAQGQYTAPPLHANTVAGSFRVQVDMTAQLPPTPPTSTNPGPVVTASYSFRLTNLPGAPVAITAETPVSQTATVGQAFAAPLKALVTDGYGNGVGGVAVTFKAPQTAPSGNFSGAAAPNRTVTVTTALATGEAVAPTFTAGTTPGTYPVTASFTPGGGSGSSAVSTSFTLTNQPGPATLLTIVSGNNQSAAVGTGFAQPFVAQVTDQYGNRLSGITVNFTLSGAGNGAGGNFTSTGTGSQSVTTDQNGLATTGSFQANTTAGSYSVVATLSGAGVANPAPAPLSFKLTNQPGAPSRMVITSGNNQSAAVGTAFGQPLAVAVQDIYGNGIGGLTVNYSAGTGPGGASGTFAGGGTTASAVTSGSSGAATAPGMAANTHAGAYSVSATVAGTNLAVSFNLTNTPGAPANLVVVSGSPQQANIGTAYAASLAARLTDAYGNPLVGYTINFNAPGSGASGTFAGGGMGTSVQTDNNGTATTSTFTANLVAGSYSVNATATGTGLSAAFSLTNVNGPTSVTAYVSDPNPLQNSVETVYGKLIVNGLPAVGATMDTNWNYKTTVSSCSATSGSDGVASCSKNIGRASSGYTVVIDVVFTYQGQTYTTSTTFTPN